MRVAVASRNPGKLAELRRLLAGHPWELVDLDAAGFTGELEEPADTYDGERRRQGAGGLRRHRDGRARRRLGIEVPALGGWPGAASARWMGPDADDVDRLHGPARRGGAALPG